MALSPCFRRSALLAVGAVACARQVVSVPIPETTRPPGAPPVVSTPTPISTPVSNTPREIPNDSTILFARPNGQLIRQGTLVYDLTSLRGGQTTPLGVRTVTVSESGVGGVPAYLIAESRTGTPLSTSDSLYVSRVDLAPTRWVASAARMQLGASFTRDSIYGAMQSYQGRSSFASALPAGALVTPGMVDRIVELLPLGIGYRSAASLVIIELGIPRSETAQLFVDRDERIARAVGTTDCWVVTLRAGRMLERLWVSKDSSRVVKTEQPFAGAVVTGMLH